MPCRLGRLPSDLYIWPTARSYTGEPLVEIHTLGSAPVLDAVLRLLCANGARLARPGEFTLRAFLSGRLDLTQAEAVLGLIEARNEREHRAAIAQLAGGLGRSLTSLRNELLDLLAELEAGLDFAEEDIEFVTAAALTVRLDEARQSIERLSEQMQTRNQAQDQARIVLAGSPNVGKSSLFNHLATDAAALVSPTAGTTRDYLIATLELAPWRCQLVDTAGLAAVEAGDDIAQAAQRLAAQQQGQATIELFCLDGTRAPNGWELARLAHPHPARLVVVTKTDQPRQLNLPPGVGKVVLTSSATGAGLDELRGEIGRLLAELSAPPIDMVAATAQRCRESLGQSHAALTRAVELARPAGREELVAAELRTAIGELGKVVGAVYTDDLLDRIFSRFCIGK